MSITKDDVKIISRGLEPQFRSIRREMKRIEHSTNKKLAFHTTLIMKLQTDNINIRKEMKQWGIDLKKWMSRMIKESYELFSQNHPTREEVYTQIDDLRDEFKNNSALLQDKRVFLLHINDCK